MVVAGADFSADAMLIGAPEDEVIAEPREVHVLSAYTCAPSLEKRSFAISSLSFA